VKSDEKKIGGDIVKIRVIWMAVFAALILLACSPEEVGIQVETTGGKLDRITKIPEMTRQDYSVMSYAGKAGSMRELEPQLFKKHRWELRVEAAEKMRTIINEKDVNEIIDILSYQVIVTDSNVGIAIAVNRDGLQDDTIGKVIVNRMYVTEDAINGIRVFVTVNHPGKAVMPYINFREVRLKEQAVEITKENIDQEIALNKHRRWLTEKAEGRKRPADEPLQTAPAGQKLSEDELLKLPPLMRQGR
jgi:hypothetical protein